MQRSDPLQLLRSAYNKNTQKKTTIKLKGSDLYFDRQIKLPLDTETAWQSTNSGKQFNLGSLWLYLQLHFQKIPNKSEYYKQVAALKLESIGISDGDQIVQYFSGEVNQSKCINNELKAAIMSRSKGREKPGVDQNLDNVEKKIKTEGKLDEATQNMLRCLQYLNVYQKPINSKSRCLRYPNKKFINILTHLMQNQGANNQPKSSEQQSGKPRIVHFYEKKRLPIIIVPEKTIPGNISLQNIQKFLVKGEYDEYAKLHNPDVSKIQIERQLRGKNIAFQVNCRPDYLSEKDWEFVVAVFVTGKENQFDQWPYKTHKKVFQNTLGYMVKFPKTHLGGAAQWKCQIKTLDPISRIADKDLVKGIWLDIQGYIFARI